jgi:hypothetical protein
MNRNHVAMGILAVLAGCGVETAHEELSQTSMGLTTTDTMELEVEHLSWTSSGGEWVDCEHRGVRLSGNEVGSRYGFVQAVPVGTYKVAIKLRGASHGSYRVVANGRTLGVIDGFINPNDCADHETTVELGNATSSGTMQFEFVHIGGAVGEADYELRIDSIVLTRLPSPFRAYWDFEKSDGNVVTDTTGHGYALTLSNASLDSNSLSGMSLGLLAANASASAATDTLDASASFSISVWAELDQLHAWDTVVSQDGQNVSAFYLQKRDNGRFAFTTLAQDSTSSSACVAWGNIQPKTGQWYHLAATWDAVTREQRLYVDGVLSGLASCPGGFKATGPLVVGRGRWVGPADWMRGRIDELGVVARALAPTEVADIYRQERPDTSPAPVNAMTLAMNEQTWSASGRARAVECSSGVRFHARAVGDVFAFAQAVPAGSYRAVAHVETSKTSGTYDVEIDGRRVGTISGYDTSCKNDWKSIDLGMVVSNGSMSFKFVCTGSAPGSRDYDLTIDWISLEPSPFGSFWDFESQANGLVPDVSGHGIPLTLENASLAAGPDGNFVALGGWGSDAAAPSTVLDTSRSFSISAWARLDQLDAWDTFASQDGQQVSAFYLQKRDSHLVAFTTFPEDNSGASPCIAWGALRPKPGEWYHLVATRDAASGEQRIYVDGVLSGKAVCVGGFKTTGPLAVGRGRWWGPVDFMKGGLDNLGIASRVLAADEVLQLYKKGRPDAATYLFTYFSEQALGRGDGLRLAHSHDALTWGGIGAAKVFLRPTVGGKSFRDPNVIRDSHDNYHLVWTTSCVPWAEPGCVQDRGFGYARSNDLVHWTDPTYVPVDLPVEHVWAPETIYDERTRKFMVTWSSPLDRDPNAPDPHSIYYMLTRDFRSFTPPAVLYSQPGRDFIDATIYKQGDQYLMFLKDEAGDQKNIRALTSSSLLRWTGPPSEKLTGNYGAEGPSVMERDGRLYLYFDKYGEGTYGALRSTGLTDLTNPASWEDISSSVSFTGVRHGTPIQVPWEVFRTVALKAGE